MALDDKTPDLPDERAAGVPDQAPPMEPLFVTKYRRIERLVSLMADHYRRAQVGVIGDADGAVIRSIYIAGMAGTGKTRCVMSALDRAGLLEGEDFVVLRGSSSPLATYQFLHQHGTGQHAKIIIFDDADGALRDKSAVNILKAIMDDKPVRTVSYLSSRLPAGLVDRYDFAGSVIFISNLRLDGSADQDLQAIRSRAHYVEVYLSQAELLAFIASRVVPQERAGTTLSDRRWVFEALRRASLNSATKISIRTYTQALDLMVLDRDHFDLHLDELVPLSEDVRLLRRLLDHHFLVQDAAREFMAVTGKSRRTFFLLKAKYRDVLGC